MFHRYRLTLASVVAIAACSTFAGVAASRLWAADKPGDHAGHQHAANHAADVKAHLGMVNDDQGRTMMKEVKAEMTDAKKLEAKKAEVLKEHKEAMMVVAHALMRQDPEMKHMMREDHEAGKH